MLARLRSVVEFLILFAFAGCVNPPPAGEQVAAIVDGSVGMRSRFEDQTAALDRLVNAAESRGMPPSSVAILRQQSSDNVQQFLAVYRAQVLAVQELGQLTIEDARILVDGTLTEVIAWREARRAKR